MMREVIGLMLEIPHDKAAETVFSLPQEDYP
jgi:hypothetical protein